MPDREDAYDMPVAFIEWTEHDGSPGILAKYLYRRLVRNGWRSWDKDEPKKGGFKIVRSVRTKTVELGYVEPTANSNIFAKIVADVQAMGFRMSPAGIIKCRWRE